MKTILLVDDSRVTRELIKVFLIGKDIRLLEAADGAAAFDLARLEQPDLLVCDLRMPRLDGPDLCKLMQSDPQLRNTPVIILTSNRDEESLRRCHEAGAREVLLKPVTPQVLHEAVSRHAGINIGVSTRPATKP
jgi:CheY-like chemotaxis protein